MCMLITCGPICDLKIDEEREINDVRGVYELNLKSGDDNKRWLLQQY